MILHRDYSGEFAFFVLSFFLSFFLSLSLFFCYIHLQKHSEIKHAYFQFNQASESFSLCN